MWHKDGAERRVFWWAFGATLLLKFVLAAWLPVTGDEAYFVIWGQDPAWGYYDHTPLVGWILALLLKLGSAPWLVRLPSVLLSAAIALGMTRLLAERDRKTAYLIATLYLVSPVNILGVLITTDIPLIFFSFYSVFFLVRALRSGGYASFALAGLCLGLAFYSKYFAVLLGISYFACFAILLLLQKKGADRTGAAAVPDSRRLIAGAALLYLMIVPFVAANIYWNYTHCWYNVMFNLFTRNAGERMSVGKVVLYLACQIYLITPPVLRRLSAARHEVASSLLRPDYLLYGCCFVVPLAVFTLLSLDKVIGLHWVLSFYPFIYLMLRVLERETLTRLINFMVIFSLVHLLVVAVFGLAPLRTWSRVPHYDSVVMTFKAGELAQNLQAYDRAGFHLAADGFSLADLLGYQYGKNVSTFGEGSYHGRQDDIETNYQPLDRRNIVVVTKGMPELKLYLPYFDRVVVKYVKIDGARFNYIEGYGFKYAAYRQRVLRDINEKYYTFPRFLPCKACAFKEHYAFD
jgi:hypothetical protein